MKLFCTVNFDLILLKVLTLAAHNFVIISKYLLTQFFRKIHIIFDFVCK